MSVANSKTLEDYPNFTISFTSIRLHSLYTTIESFMYVHFSNSPNALLVWIQNRELLENIGFWGLADGEFDECLHFVR